jgi:hypothetical protein
MTKESQLIQLIRGVDFNKVDKISALLQEGVDINYKFSEAEQEENGSYYETPLLASIITAGVSQFDVDEEVFYLLVKQGAATTVIDEEGNTPLLIAIKYFALNIFSFLAQQGADVHAQNKAGENAFNIICYRYLEELEWEQQQPNAAPEALERMMERIDVLVAEGYNLNAGDNSAAFDAITAISVNELPGSILDYLFSKGADARESKKGPLLDYAIFRNLPEEVILSMMQTIGLEYKFDNFHQFTPLNFAVARNRLSVLEKLIALGADIHVHGDQALRNACKLGHFEIVLCLVEAGANSHATDEQGNTPLFYAEQKGFAAIVHVLKSKSDN